MKHLTNLSCTDFAAALAARESVPGGGGAAAMVGALSAALCSMVANFTAGKNIFAVKTAASGIVMDQFPVVYTK